MIYILKSNFEGQPNWMDDFSTNLEKGLHEAGAEVRSGYEFDVVDDLSASDYVFVTHYMHLNEYTVNQTDAKVIFHHHGSGVSPYTHWIDNEQELYALYNTVDINTFCTPTQKNLVRKSYPFIGIAEAIGFPLDFNKYKVCKETPKKKKIIVAGHIGPERQFYLATYLLKDLMPEYEVVFAVLETPGSKNPVSCEWSKFYDLRRFIEMGYRFVRCPDSSSFYVELSSASHIFTCSLGDTFSVSIVEGILCGCIPVVPHITDFWPMYMDYINYGYNPFDKLDIEYRIRNKSDKLHVNLDLFKPELVAKRLLEVL